MFCAGRLNKRLLSFYSPPEIPERSIINYDMQIEALTGIGLFVNKGYSQTVLVFGFPGTGKSEVPFVLVRSLMETFRVPFSLTMVNCDNIAIELSIPTRKRLLKELDNAIDTATKNLPALICFDEIDALSAALPTEKTIAGTVSRWLRRFLDDVQRSDQTLVLAITNYPRNIDPAVFRRLRIPVYFDLPSLEVIEKIIQSRLGLSKSGSIAQLLSRRMSEFGLVQLGADVIRACEELKKSAEALDLDKMSDDEIANSLITLAGPGATREMVEKYIHDHSSLIQLSLNAVIPFWRRYARREHTESMRGGPP